MERGVFDGSTPVLKRPGFGVLPSTDRIEAALKAHKRKVHAGTMLVLEGEPCKSTYCQLSGWLGVSKVSVDGDRQILDFILPGDIVDIPVDLRQSSPVQVEALTYGTVAAIPVRKWDDLLAAEPELAELNRRYTVSILSRFAHGMLRLGKGNAETRLAFALLELCVRLRRIGELRDNAFHLPITQQHLGDFAGLSAVHVCRTLGRFQRDGLLCTADHTDITILDMDALAEIAGVDPERLAKEVVPSALGT